MRSKTSSASSIDTLTIIKPPNESAKDRCDHFELDRDWRRKRCDFDGRASRIWLALAREILGVEFVVRREILFHASAYPRTDSGKKKQIADTLRMWECADRLRRAFALERFAHGEFKIRCATRVSRS